MNPFFKIIEVDQKTERKTHGLTRKIKIEGTVIYVDPRALCMAVDRNLSLWGFSNFPLKKRAGWLEYDWWPRQEGEAMYFMGHVTVFQGWPSGSFQLLGKPKPRCRFQRWFNVAEIH